MQAVILAHHDSVHLRQLLASGLSSHLPLSKHTVLSNLLNVFRSAGILDVIILCRPNQAAQLEKGLKNSTDSSSRLAFVEVPASLSLPECIYRIRDRISSPYLFVTYGDLAVTDLNVRRLFLAMVRTRASVVSVVSPYTKDPKLLKSTPHDLLVVDQVSEQLVMYVPDADMKKQVRFPKQVLASHNHLVTCSDYHDVGFYLFSSFALKLLEWIRDDSGAKKNFLKHLVNVEQYRPCPFDASQLCGDFPPELRLDESEIPKSLKVCTIVHQDTAVCRRLDSPTSYLEAVKLVDAPGRTPVADCSVGADCVFGKGILVRSCILGARCKIADDSRVLSSVLLPDVTVKEGCDMFHSSFRCKLTNCLIGEGAVIEENCVLKDCTVAARQQVPARVQIQAENLGFSEIDVELV
ncbi:unnamed protein product [Schistocephalus solidus]|uniref:Translation initiation factor eIF2B subunit gamma n=1 Tax=Schistocephalus solidus TaxID=70667 RepID=A0A183S7H0_SCHSO|nr:unnamed protein product [Schistocephalus solidus]